MRPNETLFHAHCTVFLQQDAWCSGAIELFCTAANVAAGGDNAIHVIHAPQCTVPPRISIMRELGNINIPVTSFVVHDQGHFHSEI